MPKTLYEISGESKGAPYDSMVPGEYAVRGRKGFDHGDADYQSWEDWEQDTIIFSHAGPGLVTVLSSNGSGRYNEFFENTLCVEDHLYEIDPASLELIAPQTDRGL